MYSIKMYIQVVKVQQHWLEGFKYVKFILAVTSGRDREKDKQYQGGTKEILSLSIMIIFFN